MPYASMTACPDVFAKLAEGFGKMVRFFFWTITFNVSY